MQGVGFLTKGLEGGFGLRTSEPGDRRASRVRCSSTSAPASQEAPNSGLGVYGVGFRDKGVSRKGSHNKGAGWQGKKSTPLIPSTAMKFPALYVVCLLGMGTPLPRPPVAAFVDQTVSPLRPNPSLCPARCAPCLHAPPLRPVPNLVTSAHYKPGFRVHDVQNVRP